MPTEMLTKPIPSEPATNTQAPRDEVREWAREHVEHVRKLKRKHPNHAEQLKREAELEQNRRDFENAREIRDAAQKLMNASARRAGVRKYKKCNVCTLANLDGCSHIEYPPTVVWGGEIKGTDK